MTPELEYDYTGGVFVPPHPPVSYNHAVEVVGYGVDEAGRPFWRIRNSWSPWWVVGGWVGGWVGGSIDEAGGPFWHVCHPWRPQCVGV